MFENSKLRFKAYQSVKTKLATSPTTKVSSKVQKLNDIWYYVNSPGLVISTTAGRAMSSNSIKFFIAYDMH